jgi:hypothetical protein
VADGAFRIALPRLAERPHRLRLGEGVHHLETLIEERLRLPAGRRHRLAEFAETDLEQLDRLRVALVDRGRGRRLSGSSHLPGCRREGAAEDERQGGGGEECSVRHSDCQPNSERQRGAVNPSTTSRSAAFVVKHPHQALR